MSCEIIFKNFFLTNESNLEIAKITLEHLWTNVFALKIKVTCISAIPKLEVPIKKALQEAQNLNARLVMFRLIKDETSAKNIATILYDLGFQKKNERIEFKRSVIELPSDDGSLMKWKTAIELGWSINNIANILKQVAVGDPDTDPYDDPISFIQDFLADPVLTSGLRCIHIGFLHSEIAALTVIQINPKTGWSRISYMGVIPKFRKKNIGLWVHRYSFQVMKAEGGKLYHGGTTSTNIGMIRLFEKNGCNRFCEMEEWSYLLT